MKIMTTGPFRSSPGAAPVVTVQRVSLYNASLLLALAMALLLASSREVRAQTPTLEGEILQNSPTHQSIVTCDPNAGQITFEVRGIAVGPYRGEFLETGTLSFDPRTGQITGGHIDFVIFTAIQKTVVGKKSPTGGTVQCTVDPRVGITVFSVAVPGLAYTADLLVEMMSDEGQATLDFSGSSDSSTKPPTVRMQFTEIFHSSNLVRSTPGKVTGGGTIVPPESKIGITFGFNAQNTDQGMKGAGTIIDHNAGIKLKILDVQTFVVSGTHATFTGRAEVNGVEENYQLDVDDLGEPGAGLDTFKIVTGSYGGGGTLTGGNIQIHK